MSLLKKKNTAAPQVDTSDLDAVMRKYDRESNTRVWEGTPAIIIKVIMALFALYCIGMTLFSTAMPEIRLPLFLGFIIIMGFLTYPAKKGHVRVNFIPWYDHQIEIYGLQSYAIHFVMHGVLIHIYTII